MFSIFWLHISVFIFLLINMFLYINLMYYISKMWDGAGCIMNWRPECLFLMLTVMTFDFWWVLSWNFHFFPMHWAILKTANMQGLRTWNFLEYQTNTMHHFKGLIKNKVKFPEIIKETTWYFQGSLFLVLKFPGL